MTTAPGGLAHQLRYDLLIFRRNPASIFFTVMVPVVVFLIAGLLLSAIVDDDIGAQFTASLLTFAVVGATFVNLAMTMTIRRERGLLKRVRATPLSPWLFILSQAGVGLTVSLAMVALFVVLGTVLVDLSVTAIGLVVVVVSVVIGVVSFAALGLALSCFVPSEEAAPSVVQGVALPLYFLSGVFIPLASLPDWIGAVARVLPFHHFIEAIMAGLTWDQRGLPVGHWLVVAAWGLAAATFVARRFRWLPQR